MTLVHSGLAVFSLLSLDSPRLALIFGLCALVTGLVTALLYRLLRDDPEDDGGSGGGPGGPPGGDPPPAWWPGFERDFWSHVGGEEDGSPPPRDRVGTG